MEFLSDPGAIEEKSFAIIEQYVAGMALGPQEKAVVMRVIHASGDPKYARLVRIHPQAIEAGLCAVRAGGHIFTDVKMVKYGINTRLLKRFGCEVHCLIDDELVVKRAKEAGTTRAAMAVRVMAERTDFSGWIVAVGNAPTALFALYELIRNGQARPSLVVGAAVGFVGARESKEIIEEAGVPYITIQGTRGGSALAAAIVNAMLLIS